MKYKVKKQGRTWGIYLGGELVEGGFFSIGVASEACYQWNQGTRQD